MQSFFGQLAPGHYTFPFTLVLPEWLPDSLVYRKESDLFTIEYTMRAQFTTPNPKDYVVDARLPQRFTNVSIYRGHRTLFVYSKFKEHTVIDKRIKLEHRVGGVFGLGQSHSCTEILLK